MLFFIKILFINGRKFSAVLNWVVKRHDCNLALWQIFVSPGKPIFTVEK